MTFRCVIMFVLKTTACFIVLLSVIVSLYRNKMRLPNAFYLNVGRHNHFMAIIQVSLCYAAPQVKHFRILLEAVSYCLHIIADGNCCIPSGHKMLGFSSVVLPTMYALKF